MRFDDYLRQGTIVVLWWHLFDYVSVSSNNIRKASLLGQSGCVFGNDLTLLLVHGRMTQHKRSRTALQVLCRQGVGRKQALDASLPILDAGGDDDLVKDGLWQQRRDQLPSVCCMMQSVRMRACRSTTYMNPTTRVR